MRWPGLSLINCLSCLREDVAAAAAAAASLVGSAIPMGAMGFGGCQWKGDGLGRDVTAGQEDKVYSLI